MDEQTSRLLSASSRPLPAAACSFEPFTISLAMVYPKHFPPVDGSINAIPGFVDFHAEHNLSLPWVKFPACTPSDVQSITFQEFCRATHRVAQALRPNRSGSEGQVVAVLIHCDSILYLALLAGMLRAGLVVRSFCVRFLTSSSLGYSSHSRCPLETLQRPCTGCCRNLRAARSSPNHHCLL